jgi:hypothetical protein
MGHDGSGVSGSIAIDLSGKLALVCITIVGSDR